MLFHAVILPNVKRKYKAGFAPDLPEYAFTINAQRLHRPLPELPFREILQQNL
ncbi:hypothetical protein [Candidatus Tokpelaia sp.]|uniref:hypothetical protein n=1 Tax=Candidatus Tokpelaia sp. TaxID=2233777 RepID=UPI00168000AB|nr:hypothetical protein [Candidatus Tokpelaia sp.]